MANKNFNLTVNETDIKPILATLLQNFVSRQMQSLELCATKINESLESDNSEGIYSALREFLSGYEIISQEVLNMSVLIEEIKDSTAKTEILEDLPDLEKDSLGVGGGSE